ncbi:PREDICTED: paraplegin-like [Amphimedon queenslandica]|uniref:AAA+ ATPase domain-containing protein n=1 Tax=Amphimedon queenslandica TaxID=400682 RepID=A0A1X7VWH8_AMPQE|nr:PREDICTED: paraplegin-like [Amphimedon queenslandica]|eukprot:XP_019849889.1 PREDICTED: paraplegin-like [Amphimedon queenslandica]
MPTKLWETSLRACLNSLTFSLRRQGARRVCYRVLLPLGVGGVGGVWLIRNNNGLARYRYYSTSDDEKFRQTNPNQNDDHNSDGPPSGWSWPQLMPILLAIAYFLFRDTSSPVPSVPFSYFLKEMLEKGEVQKLVVTASRENVFIFLYPGAVINGRMVSPASPQFMMSIAGVESFENRIKMAQDELGIPPDDRISIHYKARMEILPIFVSSLTTIGIIGLVWYFMFRNTGGMGGASGKDGSPFNPFSYMTRAKTTVVTDPAQIGTNFKDVAGMEEAKTEVMEFVDYLKFPKKFSELGARIPKGALLHGPPGTGKTLLARAIAGEASVPFISIAGPDFVEMFAGVGSARVRDLFDQARKSAPCILYVDEIDAVGRSRQSGASVEGTSEQENTLNQLLVEMDGINPLEGVVVLASTNRVDILDQALLRPGRFDRQISIDLPTLPERKAIFEVYLKKILLEKSFEEYSGRLAALTPGHSGADIANVVNEAALHAAREQGSKVTEDDFEYAIERVIAGMQKKNSALSSEEREVIAYHEAGHTIVGWLLEHTDPVLKVSIVPRTKGILGFAQYLPMEQRLHTKEQLFDRMTLALGGRAAEAITFRRITTGAQDDLLKVTDMAYKQISEYGMSTKIGNISLPVIRPLEPSKRFYSNKLAKEIDDEARSLVNLAYSRAETLLKENQESLRKLAKALLEKEVLNYKDLVKLLGPMPYQKEHHHYKDLNNIW